MPNTDLCQVYADAIYDALDDMACNATKNELFAYLCAFHPELRECDEAAHMAFEAAFAAVSLQQGGLGDTIFVD